MNEYSVSIVIPTYNTWNLTKVLCEGLYRHEADNIDQVILVDDGSETGQWINAILPNGKEGSVIGRPNGGFTLASNTGLREALCYTAPRHIIFLISNDVQINGKFIQKAADILLDNRKYLVGNRHINFASGWNNFGGRVFDYLEGFFLAATANGWRELGLFDERYAPHDMEDVDLSTTAKSLGYKLVSLNNPNVVHKGAGTLGYNPEREAITIRNKELFRKKWVRE